MDEVKILLSSDRSGCPLCWGQNPSDVTFMHPQMCRYCILTGGGLGIGSRSGSKEHLYKELNTLVIGEIPDTSTTYHISMPDRKVKVKTIGYLPRYAKMLLPPGCSRKTKFYTPRLACNTYDLELYPIFKESEQGLTIQLHEDNLIEDWKSYFDYKKLLPRPCYVAIGV